MDKKAKLIRLASSSAITIASMLAVAPTKAVAQEAPCSFDQSGDPVTSVTVTCEPGEVAAAFATSFSDIEGVPQYDGNGPDTFNMIGGQIVQGDGVLNPGGPFLDERTDFIEMLGGNDTVNVTAGAVGEAGAPVSIYLGTGADIFTMTGGTVFGNVHGGDVESTADDGDQFTIQGGSITGFLAGDAGNDFISVSGGSIGLFVSGGTGADQITISGGAVIGEAGVSVEGEPVTTGVLGEDGDDQITVSSGSVEGDVSGGAGNDAVTVGGGTVSSNVLGDDGDDQVSVSSGGIGGDVRGGMGNDVVAVGDGSVAANVSGDDGNDQVTVSDGTVGGNVGGGAGNDAVTIDGGTVSSDVLGDDGDDQVTVSSGNVGGNVSGGAGSDTLTVGGGMVAASVTGDDGDDLLAVSGGTIGGNLTGGAGVDSVTVSGGSISGNVEGETITLTGGTIGGDISGITGNTLIINGSPTALNLRNGVVFSGTNAVGVITNEDLGQGGTQTQFFTGFDSLTLDGSTIGFGTGSNSIGLLSLTNGSTLFVRGNSTLAGSLNLAGSTINMIDGVADDVLTLGGLVINNGQIAIDLNQQTLLADRLVASSFSSSGANTVLVNLLGTPQFAGPTDIPVILTNVPLTPGTFTVLGVPGTPASLFTYEVVTGADGGLFIRASPGNFGIALAPENAVDVGTVDTAIDAVYGINNDAIAADLGLAGGTPIARLSDTFGVFASGQLAHVEHDGFTITNGSLVGPGPAFDADDFSAAVSLDFNAAKHFGLDDKYGLNIGVFAGYASTDIGLGAFQAFPRLGDADNRSGMFGGYGLFRQAQNYVLVSVSGFLGTTDITNDVLRTTGSYDTQGIVVTGSVGHIFNVTDRLRFDLRGGLLGVDFKGGDYVDSGGNRFGRSQISFGAFKFEPGIYADYQLDNGMVISPYARADLQQRFGYSNTAIIDTREIEFEDADFSAALSAGFNLKMTQRATMSGELRGKVSNDSSTYGGKLGLKIAF